MGGVNIMATIQIDRSTLENALRSAAAKYKDIEAEFRKDSNYTRVADQFAKQAAEATAMADGVVETDTITLID